MRGLGIGLVALGGGLFLISRGQFSEKAKNNISVKTVGDVTIRSLLSESDKLEIRFNLEIENLNAFSTTIEKITGQTKWQGIEFGSFELANPTILRAKETATFEMIYFLDISDRALPAIIRQTWRTGNFAGFILIDSNIQTNFGSFDYRDLAKIF